MEVFLPTCQVSVLMTAGWEAYGCQGLVADVWASRSSNPLALSPVQGLGDLQQAWGGGGCKGLAQPLSFK
jgi:hypothetical protein